MIIIPDNEYDIFRTVRRINVFMVARNISRTSLRSYSVERVQE